MDALKGIYITPHSCPTVESHFEALMDCWKPNNIKLIKSVT